MKLVIVESPGKIKKIQGYLGNTYKVIASVGHIVDLAKGGQYNMGVDLKTFIPKYVITDDKKDVYKRILDEANQASEIYLAMDDDREGNAIAWHIKQRLAGITAPIKKVVFKEITKDGIKKGFKAVHDVDENLFKAQETRRLLDRIVGFTTSPYVTKAFGENLSAGRVQSAALKIITDREDEISNFKPEKFWTIDAKLVKDKEELAAKYDSKLTDEATAKAVFAKFQNTKKYEVTSVENEEKKQYPQPPIITSKMLQITASEHKLSANQISAAAQKLYEAGLVTYIRTDSVRTEPEALDSLRAFIKTSKLPVSDKEMVYKNKDAAQDAHECIRPTNLDIVSTSSEIPDADCAKVYKVIYDYFMMSQMKPAVFAMTRIILTSKEDKTCQLKITGKMLKDKGYLEYLNKIPEGSIPNLSKGDIIELDAKNIALNEKKTTPPSRYNASSFLKEIESNGIGRPATFAEIANKIENRHYVEKNDKDVYVPTELGKKVSDKLTKFFKFVNADYTSKLETQLEQIAESKLDNKKILAAFWSELENQLSEAYKELNVPMCPKCSAPLRELTNKQKNEKFFGCSAYPNCKFTKSKESN